MSGFGTRPRTVPPSWQRRCGNFRTKSCAASKRRKEPLDHILLHGGPGLGKTTLAIILARELGVGFHITSGAAVSRGADMLSKLNEVGRDEIIFIDEVHRLKKPVEELLYPVLEDFRMDVNTGKGPSARLVRIPLERFTMVGATTRLGALAQPFRNRFGIIIRLEPYEICDLVCIAMKSAAKLGCKLDEEAAHDLARRSRGTPRILNHLLRRARDYAETQGNKGVDAGTVKMALEELGIDAEGLDEMDRKLLSLLVARYRGEPVGLRTLADAVGEEDVTIEELYEPYLIQAGYLVRSTQGRRATEAAMRLFGAPRGRLKKKPA